jgi:death-on-curing protein
MTDRFHDMAGAWNSICRPASRRYDRGSNLGVYGTRDAFDLTVAYAFGVAKAHTFVDGNKRTAFVAAFTFLRLNGYAFRPEPYTGVRMIEDLAASTVSESGFAKWLRTNASSLG